MRRIIFRQELSIGDEKYCPAYPQPAAVPAWDSTVKKPYLLLADRAGSSIIPWQPLTGHPLVDRIIIAVAPGEEAGCETEVVRKFSFNKNITVIAGGEVRQESVRRLLEQVPEDTSLVLIHDGARPLITVDLIERALKETEKWQATVAAVPVKDTIQATDEAGFVQRDPAARTALVYSDTADLCAAAYPGSTLQRRCRTDLSELTRARWLSGWEGR